MEYFRLLRRCRLSSSSCLRQCGWSSSSCPSSLLICARRNVSGGEMKSEERRVMTTEQMFTSTPQHLKNKEGFLALVSAFRSGKGPRRGHVEFINTAMRHLQEFGLHKDLESYKALLQVFPKGVLIPQNIFQRMFMHYPAHQICCIKLLDKMEWHGVQPDKELNDIVINAFGEWNTASKKMKRMMYWLPKLKHTNRYMDRRLVEGKALSGLELARLALKMMCRDPGTEITSHTLSGGSGGWIASAQSPLQQHLLDHTTATSLTVNGPFHVYVMDNRVPYLILNSAPVSRPVDEFMEDEKGGWEHWRPFSETGERQIQPSIHEQSDGTVLAMGAAARNDRQSALDWIHLLQQTNPRLGQLNVLLRLPTPHDI